MGIARKLNVAILVVFAGMLLANYLVMHHVMLPRFDAIELDAARANHSRVLHALQVSREKYRSILLSEAVWPRITRLAESFALDIAQPIAEMSDILTFQSANIDAIVMRRSDGTEALVFGPGKLAQSIKTHASAFFSRVREKDETYTVHDPSIPHFSLITTSEGLMFAVLEHDTQNNVVIIAAHKLDTELIRKFTKAEIKIDVLDGTQDSTFPGISIQNAGGSLLSASILSDDHGVPFAKLCVETPMVLTKAAQHTVATATFIILVTVLIGAFTLWTFMNSIVVRRVKALRDHFTTAGAQGTIQILPDDHGNDEIAELSRTFNEMAEHVNRLSGTAADTHYMGGMSQLASTTLHNLRNGMAPISAAAWQLSKLFDRAWLDNIATAIHKHSSPQTDSDQRAKLGEYLISNTASLVANSQKVGDLVSRIDRANKQMMGLMSVFEKYARRQIEKESVEIIQILKDAAESAASTIATTVEFRLPEQPCHVYASRVIVRQIVLNLFLHAVDKLDLDDKSPAVRVTIDESPTTPEQLRLHFHFVTALEEQDNQTSQFRAVHKDRSPHQRGLGLHWCANAARDMGGSIKIANNLSQRDSIIILQLPEFKQAQKEAA